MPDKKQPEAEATVNVLWASEGVSLALWEVGLVPRKEVITVSAGLAERLVAANLATATQRPATWPPPDDKTGDPKAEKPILPPAEKEK